MWKVYKVINYDEGKFAHTESQYFDTYVEARISMGLLTVPMKKDDGLSKCETIVDNVKYVFERIERDGED